MSNPDENEPIEITQVAVRGKPSGTIGRYQLFQKLGQGGMGEVYLGFDPSLERQVAIKLLSPEWAGSEELRQRFWNEARKQAALKNGNVATVYEVGEEAGKLFIAMEFVEGRSLKEVITTEQLLPERMQDLFLQICNGLQAAHEANIVHRDIKPANVMVNLKGEAKILDFGLAKTQATSGMTRQGMRVGTVNYMSPEQAQGQEVDHRSDIFSLGVLLYEMIAGRVPFRAENDISILYAIVHTPHVPLEAAGRPFSPELARVADRAMQKDVAHRYQSVSEIIQELKQGPSRSAIVAPVIAQKKSLAVLPFENLGLAEDDYFADGIADEIYTQLAKLRRLTVISYNSSRQYAKSTKRLRDIGKELGVDYLLSGTLRWSRSSSPPMIRISAKLIEVDDETVTWAENYDRVIDQLFALQSEMGEKVVEALGVALMEPERRTLVARQTVNLEAYDFYLRGNEFYPRSTAEADIRKAIDMYQRAVDLDPKFAHAYARLARAHLSMYWFYHDHSAERLELAKFAVDQALEIAPTLPDALQALGYYCYYGSNNYEMALEQFNVVKAHRPNDAGLLGAMGFVQRRTGQWLEALGNIRKATSLDPRSSLLAYELANTLILLRQYDEALPYLDRCLWLVPDWAEVYCKRALMYLLRDWDMEQAVSVFHKASEHFNASEIAVEWMLLDVLVEYCHDDLELAQANLWVDESEWEVYFINKARLATRLGHTTEARSYFDSARVILETKLKSQPESPRFRIHLGFAYAGLGRRDDAIAEGLKAVNITPFEKDQVSSVFFMELLALIYVHVGAYDEAVEQLRFLLSVPSAVSMAVIKNSSEYAALREHPSFQKLYQTTD